jgi:hypothetical protein
MTTALLAIGLIACGVLAAGAVAALELITHRRNGE